MGDREEEDKVLEEKEQIWEGSVAGSDGEQVDMKEKENRSNERI